MTRTLLRGSPHAVSERHAERVDAERTIMICDVFDAYAREHVAMKTKPAFRLEQDVKRVQETGRIIMRRLGATTPVLALNRNSGRVYAKQREQDGVSPASARRELGVLRAAIGHAKREGRIPEVPEIWRPNAATPRPFWITKEQYRELMRQEMTKRMRLFWMIAFNTGARSEAIEELTWDRINWKDRTADFRVPGVRYTNKRRIVAPVNDTLYAALEWAGTPSRRGSCARRCRFTKWRSFSATPSRWWSRRTATSFRQSSAARRTRCCSTNDPGETINARNSYLT